MIQNDTYGCFKGGKAEKYDKKKFWAQYLDRGTEKSLKFLQEITLLIVKL